MPLAPDHFAEFFEQLHGYPPFRWQQRLALQVAGGHWPHALSLPTASGKTACLEIAVFALACQADWPIERRTAARRIFFVVDRRIIVDEAYQRAMHLARQLADPPAEILAEVAEHLQKLAGPGQPPLGYGELRGGIYRDNSWAKTPTQPTVICTTVDQIGSRLLFRGYGLGPATRVVHAGLAANDALVILDEAHCSTPFYETGQAIHRYRQWSDPQHRLPAPFHFVVMSATPPPEIPADAVFPAHDQWISDLAEPDQIRLRKRLTAAKPAQLVVAPKESVRSHEKLAATLVARARDLADATNRRIGIIVNRVATARRVHELLTDKQCDAVLLTGRMRGIDRDELLQTWVPRDHGHVPVEPPGLLGWLGVSDDPPPLNHPVFVVATQCLEVGANLDFDALVTECASLDALRQRFGRLNRSGRTLEAKAVIVIRGDQEEPKKDDPVYGPALTATWNWLQQQAREGTVDFGVSHFESLLPPRGPERTELLTNLQMPTDHAPVMLPSHVDLWVQTEPVPAPDPDPAIFLHGRQQGSPEVHVCWRADLHPEAEEKSWVDALTLCPPSSAECLTVPLTAVQSWLRDQLTQASVLADVETAQFSSDGDEDQTTSPPAALVWRGAQNSQRLWSEADARALRPGDTLVLPADRPPAESQLFGHVLPPWDRGDETNFTSRGKAVLRLHPALLRDWPECDQRTALFDLLQSEDVTDQAADFQALLQEMAAAGKIPARLQILVKCLVKRRPKVHVHPCSSWPAPGEPTEPAQPPRGVILVAPGRFKPQRVWEAGELHETFVNDDDSSLVSCEVELARHLQRVAEYAQQFALHSGLPPELADDFAMAGRCHDLGKLDERFQAWLRGGHRLRVRMSQQPLAKSAGLDTAAEREQARRRSGYPDRGRHELLSVRLVEQALDALASCSDPELVLHLIASHHGRCRPLAPAILDDSPVSVSAMVEGHLVTASSATRLEQIDSGVADRFWQLVRRYGWWGLAWLESIFILADHRRSEDEQLEESEP